MTNTDTAKILVVDTDRERATRMQGLLHSAGFTVHHVATAFEALTLIERMSPNVVLTRWHAGAMTGHELCTALRADSALAPMKAVLVLDREHRAEAAMANGSFDLVLGADDCDKLADQLRHLLDHGADGPSDAQGEPDDCFSISGHFGILDLADLVQTVCSRRKTGTLALACGSHTGSVVFEAGMVRHARYRGLEGRRAFARLFAELRDCGRAPFSFEPMTVERVSATPCTIGKPAQLLILEVAVAQDEEEQHASTH